MVSKAKWQHPSIPAFPSLPFGPMYMHALINIPLPACFHRERTSETHRERERGRREESKRQGKAQSVYLHTTTLYNLARYAKPKQQTKAPFRTASVCLPVCVPASLSVNLQYVSPLGITFASFPCLSSLPSTAFFLLYFEFSAATCACLIKNVHAHTHTTKQTP